MHDAIHNDKHVNGELAAAAESYLSAYLLHKRGFAVGGMQGTPLAWPFEQEAWQWDEDDIIHNLERAGEFVAAEIDRLHRMEKGK